MSKTEKRTAEVIEQAVTGEELDSDKEPEANETLSIFEAPRSNFWVATLLSVLACVAVGSGGWFMWTEVQTMKHSMESVDEAIQSVNSQLVQIVSLRETTRDIRSQMERLESGIARADERNQSVINRVETMAEELAKAQVDTRNSYVLAEAEYLLKLADQRLLIERNPETATNLMQTVQGLLAQLEDGRLLSVREQLAQDIQLLSANQAIKPYMIIAVLVLVAIICFLFFKLQKFNVSEQDALANSSKYSSVWKKKRVILGAIAIFFYGLSKNM